MYLPSSPRYARIPESTLTPAPVKSAARPGRARKEHSCSIAAAFGVAAEETGWWWGRVGIEIRTMIADQEELCQLVSGGDSPFELRLPRTWLTTTYERAKHTDGSAGRLPGQSAQLNSVQSRQSNS